MTNIALRFGPQSLDRGASFVFTLKRTQEFKHEKTFWLKAFIELKMIKFYLREHS